MARALDDRAEALEQRARTLAVTAHGNPAKGLVLFFDPITGTLQRVWYEIKQVPDAVQYSTDGRSLLVSGGDPELLKAPAAYV